VLRTKRRCSTPKIMQIGLRFGAILWACRPAIQPGFDQTLTQ